LRIYFDPARGVLSENALYGDAKYYFVIERQLRKSIDRVPCDCVSVVRRYGFAIVIKQSGVSYADGMASRVATRIAECAELIKRDSFKSSLFFQLAGRRVFERFVSVYKPAGKSPMPPERLSAALDQ
jgi:hypothetical protein